MPPPRKVYVHVGLHKTGTTYLQNVLRANRSHLRDQGVAFPSGSGASFQPFAVIDLLGRGPRGVVDKRIGGSWDALVTDVNSSGLPTAVISEERLSLATAGQIRRCVRAFRDSEVHVVVTARDLGRILVSQWQESVKNDQAWSWQEWFEAVRDEGRRRHRPASQFWERQDLPAICARWEARVPANRLHVITVPRSGSAPGVLLERFASVIGVRAEALPETPAWDNETVGVSATEVLRRLNERLGRRLNQRQYDKVVKRTLVRLLADHTRPETVSVPEHERDWVRSRSAEMVAAVRSRGYPVIGGLDELEPQFFEAARTPDDARVPELLETALAALAHLAERCADLGFEAQKPTALDPAGLHTVTSREA